MANGGMERFLGGSPGRVALQLLVLCIVVGMILSALNIDPRNIVHWIVGLIHRIAAMGFGAVEEFGRYILLGAVVVIPVWIIIRLLNIGRR
ncbi:DUF6460 domain-containing protein [Segnochrobactrum spirostomi]|uniref:Integrase n=1 Tax=Segnochrobactrum spirostomi TaxID=2608987 RepID=A0A6A7Y561_9HYPH|nr:DUF6460 domain-containing protein [Segnochrobactrum spirostomi]MQT13231.1 integrase [Segnochrobactrum spirostomi]